MIKPVEMMQAMVRYLPTRDQAFAEKFIDNRDFESLRDLIHSVVYLAEKNEVKKTPNSKYSGLDTVKLNEFKGIVDEYYFLINPDADNYEDDFENTEEEEEW